MADRGRDGLDGASLRLGIERVEGQRRLPGAREPGDADQRVSRQPDGDVLQVVLARAVDDQLLGGHVRSVYRRVARRTSVLPAPLSVGATAAPRPFLG